MMKNLIYFSLLLILVTTACQRENIDVISISEPIPSVDPPEIEIIGSLTGLVINSDGNPVEAVEVFLGNETTSTDAQGKFLFENTTLFKDGSLVSFEHPDYFTGNKRFYAFANELNQVEYQLTEKQEISTFTPELGVTIELLGAQIRIPSGPYLDAGGATIQEPVLANVDFIPQNTSNFAATVPGDLTGYNLDNEKVCIHSLGLVYIELQTASGININLDSDKFLDVELPLTENISEALSYWAWDSEQEHWLEIGAVIQAADRISFSTNRLQNLMIGYASEPVRIEGNLAAMSSSFDNTKMLVKDIPGYFTQSLRPTNTGSFATIIPQGEEHTIEVKHECAVSNQMFTIPAQSEPAILDPFMVINQEANIFVNGVTTQCGGAEAPFSFVLLELADEFTVVKTDQNGIINFSFPNCSETTIGITLINEETQFASDPLELTAISQIQLGNLEQCNPIQAGYNIAYTGFNWGSELKTSVFHSWEISTILGSETKYIYTTKMEDLISGVLYSSGVYVFREGNNIADYSITFPTQGFSAKGTCDLTSHYHDKINSHRFHNFQGDITVIDQSVFPANLDSLHIDVVYYD